MLKIDCKLLMSNIRTLQNELVGATQSQKQGLVNFLNLQLILQSTQLIYMRPL